MARLYAATGDGIVRLDEADDGWTVGERGLQRTHDGGRTWSDCDLAEASVFSLSGEAAML